MFHNVKDPVSTLTHLIALIACIPVTILLIIKAMSESSVVHVVGFSIFGIALILLYAASTIYHMVVTSDKVSGILRRIDHMMIFILIAGTYTPICLIPLKGAWGYTLLALVWSIALIGIILKMFFINIPRSVGSTIYIVMGWLVVIAFVPLIKNIPLGGFLMLALGGVTYTLGGIIYATKWPHLNFKNFGFHEVFHLFVMGGSAFHILLMYYYI